MWKKRNLLDSFYCRFLIKTYLYLSSMVYLIYMNLQDLQMVVHFLFYWKFFFGLRFLLMIEYLLFMMDFRTLHADFKLLFWIFSEGPFWWFLIKNIEENIHGYVLLCSLSNLDLFWKCFNSISIQALKWMHFLYLPLSN